MRTLAPALKIQLRTMSVLSPRGTMTRLLPISFLLFLLAPTFKPGDLAAKIDNVLAVCSPNATVAN